MKLVLYEISEIQGFFNEVDGVARVLSRKVFLAIMTQQGIGNQILKIANEINYDPIPISELKLSNRAVNCLRCRNIEYVEQLLKFSRDDIMRFRNIGKHTFDEINAKVKPLGLRGWD